MPRPSRRDASQIRRADRAWRDDRASAIGLEPDAIRDEYSALDATDTAAYVTTNGKPQLAKRFQSRSSLKRVDVEVANENQTSDVPSLSRREMFIQCMLMQGASNKIIARNLVITESTVKVHILRKLRLQNRTQAAIWARNNVNEADWNNRAAAGSSSH